MPDLADFLAAEVARTSYRDVEEQTGVSRGALEKLVKRRNKKLPEIETLQGIADGYHLPLWKVVEMAGVSLGLPQTDVERARRLEGLAGQSPPLALLVERLLQLAPADPEFVDGMLIYLETAERHRSTRG